MSDDVDMVYGFDGLGAMIKQAGEIEFPDRIQCGELTKTGPDTALIACVKALGDREIQRGSGRPSDVVSCLVHANSHTFQGVVRSLEVAFPSRGTKKYVPWEDPEVAEIRAYLESKGFSKHAAKAAALTY